LDVEFLPGLEPFVIKELQHIGCKKIQQVNAETLRCVYAGDLKRLKVLRRVVAVYVVHTFAIPRPKALMGDEHLRRLLKGIENILALHPKGVFKLFRISAAGQDSKVFQRLINILEKQLNMPHDDQGDLLLIVRSGLGETSEGKNWEVAIRLTPRPLSARVWRVCNMAGGLNATLATVMNDLAVMKSTDRYLNAMCGSGTLLIEKTLTAQAVGIDFSAKALECARHNLQSAHVQAELLQADARQLPFETSAFEVITADLPWGDAVGSHEKNATLYPAFLQEMARVATKNARLVILTQDIKLFEKIVKSSSWKILESHRVYHGGHYPRMYVLCRS
jgi:16S rRNA G966 N2-methylase RsmD